MKTSEEYKSHMISVLVHNKPGVLAKVTSLFNRRGFNIESMSAGKAKNPDTERLTIVVKADDRSIAQIQKQLYKVLETVKVSPINQDKSVKKEMALIKIRLINGNRSELFQLVEIFKGKIVDTHANGVIVEITGNTDKIEAFLNLMPKNEIVEIARTGVVAMNRWE